MALIYAGLCIAEQQAVVDRYVRPFCKELDRQILPDGGHISRNPDALVELLLDLLPLRQCFVARDRPPPKELTDAIDRIMPMLRFFRTGDGTLARFNGAGPTPTDALATVLAYDDVEGKPVRLGGQLRLCAARMRTDDADVRHRAGAGAVAQRQCPCRLPVVRDELERLPDDRQLRLAVARPRRLAPVRPLDAGAFDADASRICRRPSSPRKAPTAAAAARDSPLTGPANAQAALADQGDNLRIKGSHDGYLADFGVSHARQFLVAPNGLLISSEDKLTAPSRPARVPTAI